MSSKKKKISATQLYNFQLFHIFSEAIIIK